MAVARHPAAIGEDCQRDGILVLPLPRPRVCTRPRLVLDFFTLRTGGTHAVHVGPGAEMRVATVAEERGDRPWSRPRGRPYRPRSDGTATAKASERRPLTASGAPTELARDEPLPRPEIEDE